ncbi:MAG: phosphoribosylamine--glycine ligase [Cyanobacteria bacterium P01_H01_bin.35]
MKILIIGNGGREHAIARKLSQSSQVQQIFCTPGNGGTATQAKCQNIPISVTDFPALKQLIADENISLVIVGPEVPLALGITDYLQQPNLKIFGPTKAGAILEASKSWAKDFMAEANIPTAKSATFTSAETAKEYITETPIVIKADGLAAGKGVTVATTIEMAHNAIDAIFHGEFDENNQSVVIEEFITGQEISVLALTDGLTIRPLLPAQDHKQVGEGDTGPNTGGMGAYAPTPIVTPELMASIQQQVLEPTLTNLQKRGIDYRGVVYAGLMISPTGEPKVLEFNCRFGDPETQPILSLLETPLEELLLACCEQRLAELPPINWKRGVAVCVVLASEGYPGAYEKGKIISGIEKAEATGATIFHAGTKFQAQDLITDGGRVLGVTAVGSNFTEAKAKAYAALNYIQFEGMYYRRDIGSRVLMDNG